MIVAVVPTMNEEDTVASLVFALRGYVDRVVVSNYSTDNTAFEASEAGADVVDASPGLGAAYLEAWDEIDPQAFVVHVDAGGSHELAAIPHMIDQQSGTSADLIVGTRFGYGGTHNGNLWRKWTSRAAAAACNRKSPVKVSDWTSGFRLYSPRARAAISWKGCCSNGHAWQIESLNTVIREGLIVREVPINYVAGRSSLNRDRVREAYDVWRGMAWSS